MLSICIPIYNNDCNKLVDDLNNQIKVQNVPVEIICIDDKSNDEFRQENSKLKNKCTYILLENNIGRAAIRNKFLQYANYEWLLFLDNDSFIITPNYLQQFIIKIIEKSALVICGGTHFLPPLNKTLKNNLCYKISSNSEQSIKLKRHQNIYASFMTNNFAISKNVFSVIKFDETLVGYGHEDTFFGLMLQEKKIPITYIENNVACVADDSNEAFIDKTKQAVNNLVFLSKTKDADLKNYVELLSTYFKCKQKGIATVLRVCNFLFLPLLETLLVKGFASKRIYNIYKLLLLSKADFKQ